MILLEIGDDFKISDGAVYQSGIQRLKSGELSIGSSKNPSLIQPAVTVIVNDVLVIDSVADFIGEPATVLVGEGDERESFDVWVSGIVESTKAAQSESAWEITIAPTLRNPTTIYQSGDMQSIASHADAIAAANNITHDFLDWINDATIPDTAVNIETPTRSLDLIVKAASESLYDIVVDDTGSLFALSRNPLTTEIETVRSTVDDRWTIQVDPFRETCNRLVVVYPKNTHIYEDSDSIDIIGLKERTIRPLFLPDVESDNFAAKFFDVFNVYQIYLKCELEGVWKPGEQFIAIFGQDNPLGLPTEFVDGDRYQVRFATYNSVTNSTSVRAWRVEDRSESLTSLAPEEDILPTDLGFGEGDTELSVVIGETTITPFPNALPIAVRGIAPYTYSTENLPTWLTVDLTTRQVTVTDTITEEAGLLVSFEWIATDAFEDEIRTKILVNINDPITITGEQAATYRQECYWLGPEGGVVQTLPQQTDEEKTNRNFLPTFDGRTCTPMPGTPTERLRAIWLIARTYSSLATLATNWEPQRIIDRFEEDPATEDPPGPPRNLAEVPRKTTKSVIGIEWDPPNTGGTVGTYEIQYRRSTVLNPTP